MTVPQQSPPILKILMRHKDIRAVAWIDPNGNIKAHKGNADSLRAGASTPTTMMSKNSISGGPKESVYIRRFNARDFLAVIFSEDVDFDAIKIDVDETIRLNP